MKTVIGGEISQKPYPKEVEKALVKRKFALVHIHKCGIFHICRHGYKYFTSITDDATRYQWILPLKTKDDIIPKFQKWLPYVETLSEIKTQTLRSDQAAEFTNDAFKNLLKERGIDHDYSVTYHHQHNGVAERFNRTLEEKKTKMMMITAQLRVSC